jgi:carbon monoxide dehydrogenase subunit G
MPEVEHSVEVRSGIGEVWRYVENLDNWAPYVVGFQQLQIVDDRRSIWTVRGDLGIMSREVQLQADITVWDPGARVEFTISGLTERLEGDGHFLLRGLSPDHPPGPEPESADGVDLDRPTKRGRLHRLRTSFARFVLRRLTRKQTVTTRRTTAATPADGGRKAEASVLTFKLRITPGGPMAPMLELLMAPMLEPAAEDLAAQIKAAVEGSGAVDGSTSG